MTYKQSIIAAMEWLGQQPDTLFIGQTVVHGGSFFATSLERVPMDKRWELPVAEEMQMGMSFGLGLEGYCVVSLYPRFDFILLAMNQLINHIDKLPEMSDGKMKTRIIIRTAIGPKKPLDGGPQHSNDYGEALSLMCRHVKVVRLGNWPAEATLQAYKQAYHDDSVPATLFIEYGQLYQ